MNQVQVTMLRGTGPERLRDCVAAGLIAPDVERDVQSVLNENTVLRYNLDKAEAAVDSLRQANAVISARLEEMQRDRLDRLSARVSRATRRDYKPFVFVGVCSTLASVAVGIVIASALAMVMA